MDAPLDAPPAEPTAAAPALGPDDTVLGAALLELLLATDLATTTERQLRATLEAQFGYPLAERKAFIRTQVEAYLATKAAAVTQEAEAGAVKKKGGFPEQTLSPELAAFMGRPAARRNEVVKALWVHIKGAGLQQGKKVMCDEVLKGLFGRSSVTMLSMNSLLSRHLFKAGEVVSDVSDDEAEAEEEEEPPAKRAKPAKPKAKPAPKPAPKAAPAAPSEAALWDPYARAGKKPPKVPQSFLPPVKAALTAYAYYSKTEMPLIRAAAPGLAASEASRQCGERWRNLAAEARAPFEALSAADKDRAAAEKAARAGGGEGTASAPPAPKRKAGGFAAAKVGVSAPLAALLGCEAGAALTRAEVSAQMWAYFKAHELQDPANRQYILADAALEAVVGRKRFKAFGHAKLLSGHLTPVGKGGAAEAAEEEEEEEEE